jgi:REP element-mobilizing transposase RayT
MVLGYHVVITAYGFWLPNDPRGSWSEFVRSWELLRFGKATKVDARQSVAAVTHDQNVRRSAKRALKYPPVHFSGAAARAIGRGFAQFVERSGIIVWACVILPEHAHLVIARHDYPVERAVNLLKGQASRQLIQEEVHPLAACPTATGRPPRAWGRGHWKVFLDSASDVRRAIRYVRDNPSKEGKHPQRWSFVTPFDG